MPDKYGSFLELDSAEPAGSYRLDFINRESTVSIIAPHAGKIEPGTSEVCRAIAQRDLSYYLFEGCKSSNNTDLHITSTRFDEPNGLDIAKSSRAVLAIHGQAGEVEFVNVGGRDTALGDSIIKKLNEFGYRVERQSAVALRGLDLNNICNRGQTGSGVQLEISRVLRNKLLNNCDEMQQFATAIRSALSV